MEKYLAHENAAGSMVYIHRNSPINIHESLPYPSFVESRWGWRKTCMLFSYNSYNQCIPMCGKRLKLSTDLYKLSKVDLDPDHILLPLADQFVKDTPAAHVPTLISGPTSFQIWLCEDKRFWIKLTKSGTGCWVARFNKTNRKWGYVIWDISDLIIFM